MLAVRFPQQSGRTGWRWADLKLVIQEFCDFAERTTSFGGQVRGIERLQCWRLPSFLGNSRKRQLLVCRYFKPVRPLTDQKQTEI